jgi:hypothetical protein
MTETPAPTAPRVPVGSPQWLALAALALRTAMRSDPARLAPGACILGTRALLEVAAYFDVEAVAEPVSAVAMTPDAAQWHDRHGWDGPAPCGWVVGAGIAHPGELTDVGGWGGHLIAVVQHEGIPPHLVDVTADQMHRPERGLCVPRPIVAPVDTAKLHCGDPTVLVTEGEPGVPDGTVIIYRRLDTDEPDTYQAARDWRSNEGLRKRLAGKAIRTMREVSAS